MIVGFHGCKGSGKDTAAQFLIDDFGFQKVGFADALKDGIANLFDIPRDLVDDLKFSDSIGCKGHVILQIDGIVEYDFDWREFLQRFGTQMARNTWGQDFWVKLWEEYLYRNSIHRDDIVVPDVRFQNEAHRIWSLGNPGIIVNITRPGYEPDGHESEQPLPGLMIDHVVNNNGSIDDLKVDIYELYKGLTRGTTES